MFRFQLTYPLILFCIVFPEIQKRQTATSCWCGLGKWEDAVLGFKRFVIFNIQNVFCNALHLHLIVNKHYLNVALTNRESNNK